MKSYCTWFAVLAVLAISLPDASAQFDNTVTSRRQSINSTLQSFANNVNNKVSDYSNKYTSLLNDMTSQLTSAQQTLTSFLTDSTIGASALAVSDTLNDAVAFLRSSVSAGISSISSNYSSLNSCSNTKGLAAVNVTIGALTTANVNFTITISTSSSTYVSTCRGQYTNTANDLVNQFADRTQDCLNNENTQLSRVSSILNNYMSLVRQNYQGLTNSVRYCTGLGSTSSRAEVKAQINGCLTAWASTAYPIYKSNLAQQYLLGMAMVQLEVVASNNRLNGCLSQVSATYTAMANTIPVSLLSCLATGK